MVALLKQFERKRKHAIVVRHDGNLHVVTSDNVATWLRGCEEVGLADLGISIRELIPLAVSFQEVVHSEHIEETGVTTQQYSRMAPNE
ncbi:hypothetical protein H4S14_004209, partial [Agrobacterium vitis]|nr:hypothetical protein [Agrobacterium vitis]MBE1440435.1 hypothetical protein [Agrobacterium vitis]